MGAIPKVKMRQKTQTRQVYNEELGEDVSVYAIDGRTIASLHNILGHVSIPVTTSGVYLVKIGNHETRKVVIR